MLNKILLSVFSILFIYNFCWAQMWKLPLETQRRMNVRRFVDDVLDPVVMHSENKSRLFFDFTNFTTLSQNTISKKISSFLLSAQYIPEEDRMLYIMSVNTADSLEKSTKELYDEILLYKRTNGLTDTDFKISEFNQGYQYTNSKGISYYSVNIIVSKDYLRIMDSY